MAVRQNKNGKWISDFRINGKKIIKQHERKKDAQNYIAQRKARETSDILTEMENNFSTMQFSEIAEKYVNEHLSKTRAKGNVSYVNNIVSVFGCSILSTITPSTVRAWILELFDSEYEISTIEKHLTYFKRVFSYAVEMEVISRNPISHISFKKRFKMKNRRNTTIDHEQFKEMFTLFEKERWYTTGVLLTLWHTGMRIGEVLNLKWDHVKMSSGVIVLQADEVKEMKVRTIGVEKEVLQLLEHLKRENDKKGARGKTYVFGITGDNPQNYQTFYKNFRRVLKGSSFSHLNIHDIRHCYTKRKRQEGNDREVIKTQQGHSSDSMFNWYNDIDVDEVTDMSGFNDEKKHLLEPLIQKIKEIAHQESIPIGTIAAMLR